MEFKVVSDVPVPPLTRVRGDSKYPFGTMLVGQSFAVSPGEDGTLSAIEVRLRGAAGKYSTSVAKGTVKFTVRKLADEVRVWRVA